LGDLSCPYRKQKRSGLWTKDLILHRQREGRARGLETKVSEVLRSRRAKSNNALELQGGGMSNQGTKEGREEKEGKIISHIAKSKA